MCKFSCRKNDEELQYSADKFQSDESCKFIVCDELGGEGRNFQIADSIIHFDMPWSPIILEQRIGRLDRVGRDNKKRCYFSSSLFDLLLLVLPTVGISGFNDEDLSIISYWIFHIVSDVFGNYFSLLF